MSIYESYPVKELIESNKYSKWYFTIIDNVRNENRIKRNKNHKDYVYLERHHVLPKAIYPEFDKEVWNLVFVTTKEHFILHRLLEKMFKNKKHILQMSRAITMMKNNRKGLSSWQYSLIYERYKTINSGENHPQFGKKHSEETVEKIRKSKTGQRHSKDTKSKMSISSKNRNRTKEHAENISAALKGYVKTSEHLSKISLAKLYQVTDGNRIYSSIHEAAETYKITPQAIRYRINSLNYVEWKRV